MICDYELGLLLISNVCIVGLIFGLILEMVFIVQSGYALVPLYINIFFAVFMMEHLILFAAAMKVIICLVHHFLFKLISLSRKIGKLP